MKTAKLKRKDNKRADEAKSTLKKLEEQEKVEDRAAASEGLADSGPPAGYTEAVATVIYQRICSECHGLDEVENYDFTDRLSIEETMTRMTEKPGFEANETEIKFLLHYLEKKFLK